MSVAYYVAAAAVVAQALQVADDVRARDGTAVFFNLCGSTVAGAETAIDPARFKFTQLSPDTVAKIRPMSKGQKFWDVHGLQSDLHALVHIETNGVCAVEIVEASEPATRADFADGLHAFAAKLSGTLQPQPDSVKSVEGKPMTASQWRLTTPTRSFLLGLTTYPDSRFMTQHIMMLTETR
jgi:hypothetical protein